MSMSSNRDDTKYYAHRIAEPQPLINVRITLLLALLLRSRSLSGSEFVHRVATPTSISVELLITLRHLHSRARDLNRIDGA